MGEFFAGFGLRDWLLIFGPLLIIGILVHGYWRMQVNRNSLKMKLDKSFVSDLNETPVDADELSLLRAELPNGGARVLSPTEQTSLNLDGDVPVLMNVAEESEAAASAEETAGEAAEEATPIQSESILSEKPEVELTAAAEQNDQPTEQSIEPLPDGLPEKYVVINVMAVGEPFAGQQLLECLLEQDMAIGEMSIFHRMQGEQTLFSLMNAVEPGSFDMATIAEIETPAISMFMRVHEIRQPVRVFQQMLEVAAALAEELGGEVRDETRSVMTTQTIEHCRQQLQEYVLKHHPA